MLQPLVRRTWAPRSEPPQMYCWDRHDRLSVISVLTMSSRFGRIGLHFAIREKNVKTPEVERFIRDVQLRVRRPLIVVMSRIAAHRSAAKTAGEIGAITKTCGW